MRAVVSRVKQASVQVDEVAVGRIGGGLLVLLGATHSDTEPTARTMARKIAGLRVLRDGHNDESSALERHAEILVVSQFTLYGDTRRGRRPSWSAAAPAAIAEPLLDSFVRELRGLGLHVETGWFGATMAVHSVNDGPLTLVIESE